MAEPTSQAARCYHCGSDLGRTAGPFLCTSCAKVLQQYGLGGTGPMPTGLSWLDEPGAPPVINPPFDLLGESTILVAA